MHEDGSHEKARCVILADSHPEALGGICGLLDVKFDVVVMLADKPSLFETIGRIQPELVVVDLALRPTGAVDIARQINEFDADVKYIILSIHDDPSVAEAIIESGASGFVFKPCVSTDLFAAVDAVRQGQVFVSPRIRQERPHGPQ